MNLCNYQPGGSNQSAGGHFTYENKWKMCNKIFPFKASFPKKLNLKDV